MALKRGGNFEFPDPGSHYSTLSVFNFLIPFTICSQRFGHTTIRNSPPPRALFAKIRANQVLGNPDYVLVERTRVLEGELNKLVILAAARVGKHHRETGAEP